MFEEAFNLSCNIIDERGYIYYKNYYEDYNYNKMPTVAIKIAKKYKIINNYYLLLAIRLYDLEYIKLYLKRYRNKLNKVEDMVIKTSNLLFIDNFMNRISCSHKLIEAYNDIRWDRNNNYSRKLR